MTLFRAEPEVAFLDKVEEVLAENARLYVEVLRVLGPQAVILAAMRNADRLGGETVRV